jgi:hypothetical protein
MFMLEQNFYLSLPRKRKTTHMTAKCNLLKNTYIYLRLSHYLQLPLLCSGKRQLHLEQKLGEKILGGKKLFHKIPQTIPFTQYNRSPFCKLCIQRKNLIHNFFNIGHKKRSTNGSILISTDIIDQHYRSLKTGSIGILKG